MKTWKILVTTTKSTLSNEGGRSCHTLVVDFDTYEEALFAVGAINKDGDNHRDYCQFALPLFDCSQSSK
ncbi:hypothetical protein M0R72_07500 [Candidatus Pacearchaeota archaeon]|jgi:hypothetical protein|nr:hypothetical protein [Candidatus Pacearchaeota archaeon]